jgi:transcriptional regulator with XRE-family HTH domain
MKKIDKQKIIGQVIKDTRVKKKLTQQDVSVATKLSRNYICDIENGRYMPSVDTLTKIGTFLQIDFNFLTEMT